MIGQLARASTRTRPHPWISSLGHEFQVLGAKPQNLFKARYQRQGGSCVFLFHSSRSGKTRRESVGRNEEEETRGELRDGYPLQPIGAVQHTASNVSGTHRFSHWPSGIFMTCSRPVILFLSIPHNIDMRHEYPRHFHCSDLSTVQKQCTCIHTSSRGGGKRMTTDRQGRRRLRLACVWRGRVSWRVVSGGQGVANVSDSSVLFPYVRCSVVGWLLLRLCVPTPSVSDLVACGRVDLSRCAG
ncbi:hypothetical protein F5Y10DRAFT_234858 [Nemania abortiva]|nr:hypothetical protein F5Y10DRAFT_234858 [Nemania abortiva]